MSEYSYIEVYLNYPGCEDEEIGPGEEYFKVDPNDKDTIKALKILKPYFEDKEEIYCAETDGNKMTIKKKVSKVKIKRYDSYIDILKADWLFPSYDTGLICCNKIDPFIDLVSEFGYLHPIVKETFKYIYEIDSNFLNEYMSWAELNGTKQDTNIFVNSLKLK